MKKPRPVSMHLIPDYDPRKYDKEQLKKWCVEQAVSLTGRTDDVTIIKTAQKIYDWVIK